MKHHEPGFAGELLAALLLTTGSAWIDEAAVDGYVLAAQLERALEWAAKH